MSRENLNERIKERGREFFKSISGEAPSVFNKSWWTGKVMDWAMKNENFKVQLFRFVDVLPYLSSSKSLARHIQEYFGGEQEIPTVLKWGAKGAGGLGRGIAGKILAKTIYSNIQSMAMQFIIGENTKQALKTLNKLRKDNFAFTVDILGEATVSEEEALYYQKSYLDLLDVLHRESKKWKGLISGGDLDWGYAPKINCSIKPSALYSQARAVDFENTVETICKRLRPIVAKTKEIGGHLCIDMEQYAYKNITLEVYKRLKMDPEFKDFDELAIVFQAYLKDTDKDLEEMLEWARTKETKLSIRLVKGAYWDYETVIAKQRGWEIPVYTIKAESDAAFERQAELILKNHDICYFACGSHNIRTISAVMEMARDLGVPEERYEFQVLYGMAEPVRKGLLKVAKRVRLYAPYGELIPGMAYLVRRLLENTANESFLRLSFAEGAEMDRLLEDPKKIVEEKKKNKTTPPRKKEIPPFKNHPFVDFTREEQRRAFKDAILQVRKELGRTYPLIINGEEIYTQDRIASINPADPEEIVGYVCQASKKEIDRAIEAAQASLYEWRETSAEDRAKFLFKAADYARENIFKLASWQVLEVGKQWDQAYADVAEAIDFLEYYAREMLRLGRPRRMGRAPGEINHLLYQGKGIAAVIAPWNFPLAISCGMTSAALVTGNCVLYKPASLSSVVGYTLAEIYNAAGLPKGVFHYVPGRGSEIGDYLVEHPQISLIAFTGSMEVGLRIVEKASRVKEGQEQVKRVIAEMGGKNAIIIDDDADLDEAVLDVIYSAFGYQGQKCSACSRVIVLEEIYDRFVKRLVEAARSIAIGPAEDPHNYMGCVVDENARKKILNYIELAKKEGKILLLRDDVPKKGFYVPLTIVEGITPKHRLAQEEIFGPVLSIMRVKDFEEALEWANSTRYALTGGVFSRSPKHLEMARSRFKVGNLYLNRGITGALVERQPFGGFKMSGVGSKAGGPDYLLQFMDPICITENTMRRGFAPISEEDDWIE